MREIKFRAWDEAKQKLLKNVDLIDLLEVARRSGRDDYGKLTWMQYTGLKDKNGVDIYEGDIVRYQTRTSNRPGVVTYGVAAYMWHHASIDFYMWDMDSTRMEVIGNIYENPELLEEAS